MSSVVEASAREVFEAYVQAIQREDIEGILFWRPVVVERLVVMRGIVEDYLRDSGADGS